MQNSQIQYRLPVILDGTLISIVIQAANRTILPLEFHDGLDETIRATFHMLFEKLLDMILRRGSNSVMVLHNR